MNTAVNEKEIQIEYELLRDNARGIINHSRGLCVFLQYGMISWIKFMNCRIQEESVSLLSRDNETQPASHEMAKSDFDAILADALISFDRQRN